MAYSELVKNFNHIREYMREFYVYGFKSREEYTQKSIRSYDDERRRMESWLGDYMRFVKTPDGKNMFLSIDSRVSHHNPLYKAWKTKSFTDGDITLHFILMDILEEAGQALPVKTIVEWVDQYLSKFEQPRMFDESTVRKKLNEYVHEGILLTEKHGKTLYYKRTEDMISYGKDILDFFSETAPCGVIGSFLLDRKKSCIEKQEESEDCRDYFLFKHHYITAALDSEIICRIFAAMREKRRVFLKTINRRSNCIAEDEAVPLRILISVQNGRQYLMAYVPYIRRIRSFRTDNILSVEIGDVYEEFDVFRKKLDHMRSHMWGVSTQSKSGARLEHVEFTIQYREDEFYIHQRLEREKRCGVVKKIDQNTSHFSADLFDATEIIPWIRTFICRITDIQFSDKELERQFKQDIEKMYEMYGIEGGAGK